MKFCDKNKNQLIISYRMSSGIPFRWEYEILNNKVIEFVRKDIIGGNSKITCGGPITINYIFKGLKKGKTTILFRYVNFADNYIDQEEKYEIIVDDNLNVTMKKEDSIDE